MEREEEAYALLLNGWTAGAGGAGSACVGAVRKTLWVLDVVVVNVVVVVVNFVIVNVVNVVVFESACVCVRYKLNRAFLKLRILFGRFCCCHFLHALKTLKRYKESRVRAFVRRFVCIGDERVYRRVSIESY